MSPKEQPGGIFARRNAGKDERGGKRTVEARAPGPAKRGKGKGKGRPARPMAELSDRLAKEKAAGRGVKRSLRERLAAAMPLFGFLGIREIGLAIVFAAAITLMGIWHQYFVWGLLVVAVGLYVMRYGDSWLGGK